MKSLVKNTNSRLSDMPSMFDDFFLRDFFQFPAFNNKNNFMPSVNIKESEDNYELEIAAPGLLKEDFKIETDGQMLTVSAEKEIKNNDNEKERNYTRQEFSYQSFKRSFTLPEKIVETDKISANYKNGILYLLLPKTKEGKNKISRLINIS